MDIGENLDIDRLAEAVKKVTEIAMQQRDRNEAMETSVNDMLIKLREENEMLQTDQLTKLYNRHRFNVVFDKMVEDFEKE